jgi:hypothetical protein
VIQRVIQRPYSTVLCLLQVKRDSPALTPSVEALPILALSAAAFTGRNASRVRSPAGTIWLAAFGPQLVASITQAGAAAAAHAVAIATTVHLAGIPHEPGEAGTNAFVKACAGPTAVLGTLEKGAAVAGKALLACAAPVLGGSLRG